MQVNIKVHTLTIKDAETDQELTVKTLRIAESLAAYIEESEKEEIEDEVERLVNEALRSK